MIYCKYVIYTYIRCSPFYFHFKVINALGNSECDKGQMAVGKKRESAGLESILWCLHLHLHPQPLTHKHTYIDTPEHRYRKVRILMVKKGCRFECVWRNIHKCHVRVSSFILGMHARFFDPVPFFPFLVAVVAFCFIMCTNFYIHNPKRVCMGCASEINSVALEAKIYYQIKFLTEFIALSLSPNIVLLPFGSLRSYPIPRPTTAPPKHRTTLANRPLKWIRRRMNQPTKPSGDPDLILLVLPHLFAEEATRFSLPIPVLLIFCVCFCLRNL